MGLYTLSDIISKYENYGGSFSDEEIPNYDYDIEDINYKLNLIKIKEFLAPNTPRNIIANQENEFNTDNLTYLTCVLDMIKDESLKHIKEYELELKFTPDENQIITVLFIDNNKNYLGLELNINFQESTIIPFVDLSHDTLTKEQYNTLLGFTLPNKLEKLFEFYNQHKK